MVLVGRGLAKEPLNELVPAIRSKTPDATIVALHTNGGPDAILAAMRAECNEYVYPPLESATSRGRWSGRHQRPASQRSKRRRQDIGFFQPKGDAGETTVALPPGGAEGCATDRPVGSAGRSRPGLRA